MLKSAVDALNEADAVIYMVEPKAKPHDADRAIIERLANVESPVFLAINKTDSVDKPELLKVIDAYRGLYKFADIFPVSALKADNTDALLAAVKKALPEGPQYFPDDMITDQPERYIVSEIIREKALLLLQDEIPHGVAVAIETMRPRTDGGIVDIQATIFCERENHKAIVIGKNGSMLKRIGSMARHDAERLLGSRIFLELWVKSKKNWRDNDFLLKNFGYDVKNI
jgi:GTP-binding protein Era